MSIKDYITDINFHSFFGANLQQSGDRLMLRHRGNPLMPWLAEAALQIDCRKKYASKFAPLLNIPGFLFPDSISAEQATDCAVARYHAGLAGMSGNVLDMTAGLGIDSLTIAQASNSVTAVEINPDKAAVLRNNAKQLGLNDFRVINGDSVDFLLNGDTFYDIIFIDPARRDSKGARTYSFADCVPDINILYPVLLKRARRVMIKASPMLDVSYLLDTFPHICDLHIVALNGECKEVLICSEAGFNGSCRLHAVNLSRNGDTRSFSLLANELGNEGAPIAEAEDTCAGCYLYIPDAAVMKLPCSHSICRKFDGMKKLSTNTSVYTSRLLFKEFPGRTFIIESIADKKNLKLIKKSRRSVISRSYPESAEAITARHKLLGSDTDFLIAARIGATPTPIQFLAKKLK